jgi:hypothetical protein
LIEKGFATNTDFFRLSDGFKRVFTDDVREKDIRIPITGHTGHKKGMISENYFGKGFRETQIESLRK